MDAVTRENKDILAAVAPFATWVALQSLLPATAGAYALRAAATLGVLAAVLPRLRRLCPLGADSLRAGLAQGAWGLLGGLVVLALWTLPEASALYRTWCVWPFGAPPAEAAASPYAPAVCGWPLTLAKLVGSAFVIAPVEEIFFRSFLYRWLQRRDFAAVPQASFDLSALLWTILLFTLEHDRPLAAALCGLVYGLLVIRCGLLSAIVAHMTTNLLLAVYVVACGQWAFW